MGAHKKLMLQHSDIYSRLEKLRDILLNDPDRPYWQVEFCQILLSYFDVCVQFEDRIVAADICAQRLDSLEHRYSELLYKMSDRK